MQPELFNGVEQEIKKGAIFSKDGTHRYSLWRIWDESLPCVMFIGLNPSTANDLKNDPTIESVIRLSKFNGYGGFYMMNCWPYISSNPDLLLICPASDIQNDAKIKEISEMCKDVVFAWGNFKIVQSKCRDKELIKMFPNALCIGKNKNGTPMHPLFKKGTITFSNFFDDGVTI